MPRILVALVLVSLAPQPAGAELRAASLAVRRGHDVGSVAVPGTRLHESLLQHRRRLWAAGHRDVGLDLAVYERFAPVYGGGDPAFEFVNSVGLELALRFGR